MTGKLNLPSVRSSARPLRVEYPEVGERLRWSSRIWKRRPIVETRGAQSLRLC
jgi:hypothetical protein